MKKSKWKQTIGGADQRYRPGKKEKVLKTEEDAVYVSQEINLRESYTKQWNGPEGVHPESKVKIREARTNTRMLKGGLTENKRGSKKKRLGGKKREEEGQIAQREGGVAGIG